MEGLTLPIDLVPGRSPPVFRWKQVLGTPNGRVVVDHEASLPPSVEVAVERLINMTKQVLMDNAGLEGQVTTLSRRLEGAYERVANQSELLNKKAEKPDAPPVPTSTQSSKGKK